MGVYIEDSLSQLTHTHKMYKLVFAALLATAAAIPIEDTADVAAAKAAFKAAFDDAVAGGLAAKQAAAPVHEVPVPAPLTVAAAPALVNPYVSALNTLPAAYPYGLAHAGLGYAGLGYAGLGYAGLGYAGLGYPYAGLPLVAAAAPAAEE